ncbi:sugar ABC transporter ATP-binding protein [Leeia oryzae]|uniref:sugar ABC transporter ATP-binding protein n=1 Tax=Leeia oryzae TaxID=356662 RepID=UPI00039EFDB8|nr:sugar ABC transporter ATP-binding protein [Leeia oryzae]
MRNSSQDTVSRMQPAALDGKQADAGALLSLEGITKRFPSVLALDAVSFDLRRGEVHALCGENGAGKSTMMKVISGQYQPDGGRYLYKGNESRFRSTREAEAAGIAIIHQELNLIPHLTVAENIFLAREPRKGLFIHKPKLVEDARFYLNRLGVEISPDAMVKNLSVAQQQMVEIAKALSLKAEVLIMDEPTSSLTDAETEKLFKIIRELRQEGVAIVYISHRLDELAQIVDRVTVMRDGKHIATDAFADTSVDQIVARMVGRSLQDVFPPKTAVPSEDVLLSVRNLSRKNVFGPVSFDLKRGEILGFAGLMGAGRTEVARAIFGADLIDDGDIMLGGQKVTIRSPRDAIRHGIAYLSEDRKSNGLALKMNVAENITMANMQAVSGWMGHISFSAEARAAAEYVKAMDIRTPSIHKIVRLLSGGNQQKIVISKWLFRESRIMFFDEPTRGIDVGAKYAIYKLIDELSAKGIGVVVISSELPEILGMTDRVAVFHEGKLEQILNTRETSQEEIMQYASGRHPLQA